MTLGYSCTLLLLTDENEFLSPFKFALSFKILFCPKFHKQFYRTPSLPTWPFLSSLQHVLMPTDRSPVESSSLNHCLLKKMSVSVWWFP